MQCLAGAILVILLIQNSLGQNEEDPGCGEKPRALNNYMRRLNNAENESERPEDPKKSEDPNDPKSRMSLFSYKAQSSYYPTKAKSRTINIIPGGSWMVPSGSHSPPGLSSFFQYGISGGTNTIVNSFKYKVNIPADDVLQRVFKLYIAWPDVKDKLQIRHSTSFRDVLRASFNIMYPEWDNMKMNMIFGGMNEEIVLKNLFVAMFPNWPQHEINDIFAPGNTIPLIIRKLLLYLVPDMTQKEIDYIFSNTNSVKLILQRICEILFPIMKTADIFNMGNSLVNIFDGLLRGFFPNVKTSSPIQWSTIMFPGMTYNITSSEPNLQFLLSQYKNEQSMPVEPVKRENMLMFILLEWLKQNPHIKYKLPEPGMDDFHNFKLTLFQNAPRNTVMPREFQDDNFLRELFELWKRFVIGNYPNDKKIDLTGILDFLSKFIQGRVVNNNPNMLIPGPTFPPTTDTTPINEIPNTITISFLENLKDILPHDMKMQLIELLDLPDKTKSGPLIMKILSNWHKYKLKNRVPLSKLMKIILRIIASNWPESEVERVVDRNPNIEQILINLFKVMFLEWPDISLDGKINSPQFILEMLLKKALPHVPKYKIETAVGSSNDLERVLHKLLKIIFPDWPRYEPSNMNFDPEVLERILTEIINWPRTKSTIIAKGTISIPLLVESFIRAIFPSWPQYIVSMITVGRTPLPLVVQKIIQMIATKHEDKELVLHFDEQSPMVQIPEALFRKIFPDWPNYSAILNIQNRRERNAVLSQTLRVAHGPITKNENSLKCLNDRDNNWAFALFTRLLKFVEQCPAECPVFYN